MLYDNLFEIMETESNDISSCSNKERVSEFFFKRGEQQFMKGLVRKWEPLLR